MPEGDTLRRTADGLRPYLVGRTITAASARRPGPQVGRVVGARVDEVEAVGKNLLIRFDNGLELRTHLRMTGSWHRYRPGERWRLGAERARLVLEVPEAVAVCFDAPVVELFEQRAEATHPALAELGPDLLAPSFVAEGIAEGAGAGEAGAGEAGVDEALRRLRATGRRATPIAEAIVDQRAVAGIGNIWKSESLWHERLDPFVPVGELSDEALRALLLRARALMLPQLDRARALPDRRSRAGGPSPFAVYRRAGRPCRRCGTPIRSRAHGELPRTTYWCPSCQAAARSALSSAGGRQATESGQPERAPAAGGRQATESGQSGPTSSGIPGDSVVRRPNSRGSARTSRGFARIRPAGDRQGRGHEPDGKAGSR